MADPLKPGAAPINPQAAQYSPQDIWNNWAATESHPQFQSLAPEQQIGVKQKYWTDFILGHPAFQAGFQEKPAMASRLFKAFMGGSLTNQPGAYDVIQAEIDRLKPAETAWGRFAQMAEHPTLDVTKAVGLDRIPAQAGPVERVARNVARFGTDVLTGFTSPMGAATLAGPIWAERALPEALIGSEAFGIAKGAATSAPGSISMKALQALAKEGGANLLPETAQALQRYSQAQRLIGAGIGAGFGTQMAAQLPEASRQAALYRGLAQQAHENIPYSSGAAQEEAYYRDQADRATYGLVGQAALAGLGLAGGVRSGMSSLDVKARPVMDYAPYTPMRGVYDIVPETRHQMEFPFVPDRRVDPGVKAQQGELPFGPTAFDAEQQARMVGATIAQEGKRMAEEAQAVWGGSKPRVLPEPGVEPLNLGSMQQAAQKLTDLARQATQAAEAMRAAQNSQTATRPSQQEILWGPGASFTEGSPKGTFGLPTTGAAGLEQVPENGVWTQVPKSGQATLRANPKLDQVFPFAVTPEGTTAPQTVPGYDVIGKTSPTSAEELFKNSQGVYTQAHFVPEAEARTYLNTLEKTRDLDSFQRLPDYAQRAIETEIGRLQENFKVGTGPYNKTFGSNLAAVIYRDPFTHQITGGRSMIPGTPETHWDGLFGQAAEAAPHGRQAGFFSLGEGSAFAPKTPTGISEPEFTSAVSEHMGYLKRVAYGVLKDPTRAEDAVQEGLARAWQFRAGFQGESSLKTWLTTVIKSAALDDLRKRGAAIRSAGENQVPEGYEAVSSESPLDQAARSQQSSRLREAIDKLPDTYRQAALDMLADPRDRSESYGIDTPLTSTQKSQRQRAVRMLRDQLKGQDARFDIPETGTPEGWMKAQRGGFISVGTGRPVVPPDKALPDLSGTDIQGKTPTDRVVPFYSQLDHALNNADFKQAPADQILSGLSSSKSGVTQREIAARGLDAWLGQQGSKTVSRQDVQNYLKANQIFVREKYGSATQPSHTDTSIRLGEKAGIPVDLQDTTSWRQYVLPGPHEGYFEWRFFSPKAAGETAPDFQHPHWSGEQPLGWVRGTLRRDPQGAKWLHIEELQSDLASAYREQGTNTDALARAKGSLDLFIRNAQQHLDLLTDQGYDVSKHKEELSHLAGLDLSTPLGRNEAWERVRDYSDGVGTTVARATKELQTAWANMYAQRDPTMDHIQALQKQKAVPNHVLLDRWWEVPLKRLVQAAAKSPDIAGLSWVTASQTRDRWAGSTRDVADFLYGDLQPKAWKITLTPSLGFEGRIPGWARDMAQEIHPKEFGSLREAQEARLEAWRRYNPAALDYAKREGEAPEGIEFVSTTDRDSQWFSTEPMSGAGYVPTGRGKIQSFLEDYLKAWGVKAGQVELSTDSGGSRNFMAVTKPQPHFSIAIPDEARSQLSGSPSLFGRRADQAGFTILGDDGKVRAPGISAQDWERMGQSDQDRAIQARVDNAVEALSGKDRVLKGLDWLAGKTPDQQAAQGARDWMRDHLAQAARRQAQAINDLAAERSKAQGWNLDHRNSWVDAVERGQIDRLPVEERPMAQAAWRVLDQAKKDVQDLGTGALQTFISNYFPRHYEEKGGQPGARRPLEGSKSFRQERSFEYESEARDYGLTPRIQNPIEAVLYKAQELQHYSMATRMLQELQSKGLLQRSETLADVPEGYDIVRNGTNLFKIGPKGIGGDMAVPKEYADAINTYLAPGLTGKAWYDRVRGFANLMNQASLGISAYHAGFEGINAMVGSFALGMEKGLYGLQNLARENPTTEVSAKSVIRDLWGAGPAGVWRAYLEGRAFRDALIPERVAARQQGWMGQNAVGRFLDRTLTRLGGDYLQSTLGEHQVSSIDELTRAFDAGGGRADQPLNFKTAQRDAFRAAWSGLAGELSQGATWFDPNTLLGGKSTSFARVLWHAPFAAIEGLSAPMMDNLVPNIKAGASARLLKWELDKLGPGYTPEELRAHAGRVIDSVENRMGQMTYDNLAMNKILKDLGQLGVRSLGWQLGTFRELGGGIYDMTARAGASTAGDVLRGKDFKSILADANVTHRAAYTVALPIVVGMYGAAFHYALYGKAPEHLLDYFYVPLPDGSRAQLPSYIRDGIPIFRDVALFFSGQAGTAMTGLAQKAVAKLNPLLTAVGEMLSNKDFYGQEIWEHGKPLSGLTPVAEQFLPISIRNASRISDEGGNWLRQSLNAVGITQAPAWAGRSEAANLAREYMVATYPRGPEDAQTIAERQLHSHLRQKLAKGESGIGEIEKAMEVGTISGDYGMKLLSGAANPKTPLELDYQHLHLNQALDVWNHMDANEQSSLESALTQKFSREYPRMAPEAQKALRDKYGPLVKKFWGEED